MLKESANDADHAYRLALAWQSWLQTANAADDQFDLNTNLGGFVEQCNDPRVHQ